jgi:hypothetical protein
VSTNSEDVVVSYWSGNLPEVSHLHFISFRVLNPGKRYILYLEQDLGYEGSVSKDMEKRLKKLGIEVASVRLSLLMQEMKIPKFSSWGSSTFFKVARELSRKSAPLLWRLGIKKGLFESEVMGLTQSHGFPFSGYSSNLPYRADLFRSLIHAKHEGCNFLYVDIDICFITSIDFSNHPQGAIAQWGTATFGNSAYLMLPISAGGAKSRILALLRSGLSALPWILYNRERVADFGLNIIDCSKIDPAWSPDSVIYQNSSMFFENGSHVDAFLVEINEKCVGVHWHNQWQKTPEVGSPYERLLSKFNSDLSTL